MWFSPGMTQNQIFSFGFALPWWANLHQIFSRPNRASETNLRLSRFPSWCNLFSPHKILHKPVLFSIPFGINKTNACKFVGKTYYIMRKVAVALIPRWFPLLLSVTMVTYSIKRKIIFASLTVYTIELCLLWVLNGSSNFLPLLWLAS